MAGEHPCPLCHRSTLSAPRIDEGEPLIRRDAESLNAVWKLCRCACSMRELYML